MKINWSDVLPDILAALDDGATLDEAAVKAGISPRSLYARKAVNADFAAALDAHCKTAKGAVPISVLTPDRIAQGGIDGPVPTLEDIAAHGWRMARDTGATPVGAQFLRAAADAVKAIKSLPDTFDDDDEFDEVVVYGALPEDNNAGEAAG